jgi:hypothetical protein
MANPEQIALLRSGVEAWNSWRKEHPNERFDLTAAELGGANLWEADLHGVNLHGANLRWANLRRANLRGAILTSANLYLARFDGADLSEANLSWAAIGDTVFADTDLTGAKGLDSINHYGPSAFDYRTLVRSGPLPPAFLRGVGLPDHLIDYLPSLLNEAIQFYACFIGYSSKDQVFAERLHADLQNKGVRCWYAPEDIQGGKKIHEQIDEAIRLHDKLLLILSEASIASTWVEHELRRALRMEVRESRRVLFPIRLIDYEALRDWECFDADTGKDLATEIREYFIPDFSTWKQDHDAYQRAFDRLLRDLRAEGAAPAPP